MLMSLDSADNDAEIASAVRIIRYLLAPDQSFFSNVASKDMDNVDLNDSRPQVAVRLHALGAMLSEFRHPDAKTCHMVERVAEALLVDARVASADLRATMAILQELLDWAIQRERAAFHVEPMAREKPAWGGGVAWPLPQPSRRES
jgi:hypothetical protein